MHKELIAVIDTLEKYFNKGEAQKYLMGPLSLNRHLVDLTIEEVELNSKAVESAIDDICPAGWGNTKVSAYCIAVTKRTFIKVCIHRLPGNKDFKSLVKSFLPKRANTEPDDGFAV